MLVVFSNSVSYLGFYFTLRNTILYPIRQPPRGQAAFKENYCSPSLNHFYFGNASTILSLQGRNGNDMRCTATLHVSQMEEPQVSQEVSQAVAIPHLHWAEDVEHAKGHRQQHNLVVPQPVQTGCVQMELFSAHNSKSFTLSGLATCLGLCYNNKVSEILNAWYILWEVSKWATLTFSMSCTSTRWWKPFVAIRHKGELQCEQCTHTKYL